MNLLPVAFAFALSSSAMASDLSDSPLSQSDDYPNIAHRNIHSAVSAKDYDHSMRYPVKYLGKLNRQHSDEYDYGNQTDMQHEPYHLAPQSADGNPDAIGHMSPAPRNKEWDLRKSDRFEIEIYRMVCAQKVTYCGSTAHDIDKQALGIQQFCAWRNLSSWTWVWSCGLKAGAH